MDISAEIRKKLKEVKFDYKEENVGEVVEVRDGIVIANGLSNAGMGELVFFESVGVYGLVLNIERFHVGIIVLGDYTNLKEGDIIVTTGKQLSISVNEDVVGRVIDPLGNPLDGKGPINTQLKTTKEMPLEKVAPGVLERKNVKRSLPTGIKVIDGLIPIGKGQRELIIGDRQTGKTSIALSTIFAQKSAYEEGKSVYSIFVMIGQKRSTIARIIAELEKYGAMKWTTVVVADSATPAALQYIAPYAGCAIGEYFAEEGKDALVVYDDLSKHAWAYREISLLLKRPAGREAYPGDIFYLHSRLLERALQYSDAKGGGSLSALPIVETLAGDVSAYIPTNIISITDGQIFLEPDLFNAGQRPAVNIGISVSRVGGDAQLKPMKQVVGQLKLDLAQYRELAAFAQFGSDLDKATKEKLDRGARIMEALKQNVDTIIPIDEQVLIFYALVNGYLDDIEIKDIKRWEEGFRLYINSQAKSILTRIRKGDKIENELKKEIDKLIKSYNIAFV